ncbi:MAG: hypothetical protein HY657_02490 [Acidobacteria bacterium]|nr:hypothetical protein [Acidobacteriota bacterium]
MAVGVRMGGRLLAGSMNPEIQRHIRAVVDAHDEAFRALRTANEALVAAQQEMGAAIEGMSGAIRAVGAANDAMGTAGQAHDGAIKAALAANRAAIDLLEYLSQNGQ